MSLVSLTRGRHLGTLVHNNLKVQKTIAYNRDHAVRKIKRDIQICLTKTIADMNFTLELRQTKSKAFHNKY